METVLSRVGRWPGRIIASRLKRRMLDLTALERVPDSLTTPLRRDGLHPLPGLGERRDAEPVTKWGSLLGTRIWLVTGDPEARAVLADTTSFSTDIRPYLGNRTSPEQTIGGLGFTDPPDHTRLRRLLAPEFTKRRLEAIGPQVGRIVEDRLDAVAAAGPDVDLLETFAFPIPFLVICELLGLPEEDRDAFHQQVGAARFDITNGGLGTFGALSQSRAFLLDVVRRQREEPGDGLIGMIIRDHGDEIDDVELSGIADGVLVGGYETTVSMLSLGTLLLLDQPDGLRLLHTSPEGVEAVIEEMLRMLSVVQIAFPRFARTDMDLFGRQVRAGDVVICSLSAANRDPRVVKDPERFDPHREMPSHLAFGFGAHRCLGAELARLELRTALPALARRFPDMAAVAPSDEHTFRRLSIVYGLEQLPVRAW